jgi:hypothetical protein
MKAFNVIKSPIFHLQLLKIKTILSLPYWLFIKVRDGIYEITLFDKHNVCFKKGYIWCSNISTFARKKKVIADLKSRFPQFSKYSIEFVKIEDNEGFVKKLCIWASIDFELSESPMYITNSIPIDNLHRVIDKIKTIGKGKKNITGTPIRIGEMEVDNSAIMIPQKYMWRYLRDNLMLFEIILLNKKEEPIIKSYVFAQTQKAACKLLRVHIHDSSNLKKKAAYVKITQYEKNNVIIWETI